MKIKNPFYKKVDRISLNKILQILKFSKFKKNLYLKGINDLIDATQYEISFFNSLKYEDSLNKTKSKYIITHNKYKKIVEKVSNPIVVENVLKSVADVTNLFYPDAIKDVADFYLKTPNKKKFINVTFGKNVLIGKNVEIGRNSIIGHNTIIESNVKVGSNSQIGSNILIKNSLIGNNVRILDGSVIGKKGFGFMPRNKENFRYPHIGMVIIKDNVEIGCNNTIDRGSMSNTVIGENTFLDNQVHIAHNVTIGKNCVITAQVGFAGSAKIGNNVMIGGQAGISGHLNIGNNVQIGGGSGVVKNIPDNSKVMGYPAKDIKSFIKENK